MIKTNYNLTKQTNSKQTSYNNLSKKRSVKKSIFFKPDFLDMYNSRQSMERKKMLCVLMRMAARRSSPAVNLGNEGSETLAHCKATPEFVSRSMATIVYITGTDISATLTCPSHFLESSNISFIITENILQLSNSTGSVKRSYIPDTDSQIVGLNSFAGGSSIKSVDIRGIFAVFIGMLVFVAAAKAGAQPQNLRSYFAVCIR